MHLPRPRRACLVRDNETGQARIFSHLRAAVRFSPAPLSGVVRAARQFMGQAIFKEPGHSAFKNKSGASRDALVPVDPTGVDPAPRSSAAEWCLTPARRCVLFRRFIGPEWENYGDLPRAAKLRIGGVEYRLWHDTVLLNPECERKDAGINSGPDR